MVADIIEAKKDEIAALCRGHRVRSLWVFEPATAGLFNHEKSDTGLLADFGEYDETVVTRYLSLAEGLESLLDEKVVLVSPGGLQFRNVLKKHLQESRTLIYG